jgi:recombination protein RecT
VSTQIQKAEKSPQAKKGESLISLITERRQTFQSLLPEGLKADWFIAEVKVAVTKAPKLADCSTISIIEALTTCAQLGLSPSGRLGSAYLIPFKEKCTLVIGYRGYVDLAYRSGDVEAFSAAVVRQKDTWVYEDGLEPVLRHVPSEDADPGPLRAVYAVARMRGGGVSHVVMCKREVLEIKARSRSASDGPWVTDEAEMWKKTAIRRLIKLLPLSPTRAKDLYSAEQSERAHEETIEAEFTAEEPRTGVAAAKERAQKALHATSAPVENWEPSEAEKAAILEQESAHANP